MPANTLKAIYSIERSLAVDTALTRESSESYLASIIPQNVESSERPSALAVDKPSIQESTEDTLPVFDISVIHKSPGNSLFTYIPVACEALKESLPG